MQQKSEVSAMAYGSESKTWKQIYNNSLAAYLISYRASRGTVNIIQGGSQDLKNGGVQIR